MVTKNEKLFSKTKNKKGFFSTFKMKESNFPESDFPKNYYENYYFSESDFSESDFPKSDDEIKINDKFKVPEDIIKIEYFIPEKLESDSEEEYNSFMDDSESENEDEKRKRRKRKRKMKRKKNK